MFNGSAKFNQNLNHWNVSNVTYMDSIFSYTYSFNQPLNNWDVSNVTDMSRMFSFSKFNQPINNWNVSNVDDMTAILQSVKWTNIIDHLTPRSTFRLDPSTEEFAELYVEAGYYGFIKNLRASIYTIMKQKYGNIDVPSAFADLQIKLDYKKKLIHDITAKYENSVVCFDCTIIATDVAKTYVKQCKMVCPKCSYGFDVTCDNN